MRIPTAALMTGLLLISTRAHAAIKPGDTQVGINLGLTNPLGNETVDGEDEKFGKLGPAFGFNFLHQFQKYLSLGGDFRYMSFGHEDVSTGHGPVEIKSSAWTLLAIGRGDLMPDSDIRPYGLLGLGVGRVKREVDFSQRPDLNSSQSSGGVAFALGGGVDYDINKNWLAGAELRYSLISTSEDEVGTGHVSAFDALLKVGYKF
jgi:opacity protein-like surface antigen